MTGTEKIFGTSFLSGDMRQAIRVLRVPDQKADPTVPLFHSPSLLFSSSFFLSLPSFLYSSLPSEIIRSGNLARAEFMLGVFADLYCFYEHVSL